MIISLLLKKALPFALTFIFGAALSGLVGLFGSGKTHVQYHVGGYGGGRRECRMRSHKLVAESRQLTIISQPEAYCPPLAGRSVRVNVTFGADGEVKKVEHLQPLLPESLLESVEQAARQIRFTPEVLNSVPATVEREIKIRVASE